MAADNGHPAGVTQPDVLSTRSTAEVPPMPDAILPPGSNKSPAFQFYPRDFISDSNVMAMECAAVGAYIRLISVCWMEDGLPRDEKMLARIAGANAREWRRIRESVLRCFYERDGRYYHKRLDLERQKQTEFRGKKVAAGESGASKRWHSHASANGKPIANDSSSSASASATAVQTPPVSVATPPPTKPLGYKPRIDVAWPGRPPVPGALHAEFVSKLGGNEQEASRRLRDWYPTAAAPYDNQPIGDDDWKFWRARFREWQGTTVKPIQPAEPRETDEQILAKIREWDAQKARR